jgi:hypothetical protein
VQNDPRSAGGLKSASKAASHPKARRELPHVACSILLCIYVLLPKSGFVFSLNAVTMYESLFEVADDEHEVRRRLVYWLEAYWQANQVKIENLGRYYLGAAAALMLQLVFWSWALADRIA